MSIAIYARGHREPDQYPRNYVPVFPTVAEAHDFFVKFIAGKEHRFDPDDTKQIILEHEFPITLRCDNWQAVMNAEPSGRDLHPDLAKWILKFKYGSWDDDHSRPVEQLAEEVVTNDDGTTEVVTVSKGVKQAKQKAPKPEREAKASVPSDYVTITALCATLGVKPTHARAALRASKRIKPPYGWAFSPKELPEIKKLLATVKK